MNNRHSCCVMAAQALAGIMICGCGQESGINTVPVTGLVTLNEKPVVRAIVTFSSSAGDGIYSVYTDHGGEFSLRYSQSVEGIPPGDYRVTVRSVADLLPGGGVAITPPGAPGVSIPKASQAIPKRYHSFDESGLQANVQADSDNEFTFELQPE